MPNEDKNEQKRLRALKSYCILDTSEEADFDNITRLIAEVCDVPIATVTLIDSTREWFKSAYGTTVKENKREIAFCARAIQSKEVFIVPDALLDPEFCNNPMVIGTPHIRFYAGCPLISDKGLAIGTLAIKDYKPRELDALQHKALTTLAAQVMVQLELRRQSLKLSKTASQRDRVNKKLIVRTENLQEEREFLRALLESLSEGIVACDGQGKLSLFNHRTRELHGLQEEKLDPGEWAKHYGLYLADGVTPMSMEQIPLYRAFHGERVREEELVIIPDSSESRTVICNGQPIFDSEGKKLGAVVAMRDITQQKAQDQALVESEAKFSAIFNQAYMFQGILDRDGVLIDVNDLALSACGYDRSELGKKFWECGWWNHDKAISDYIHEIVINGQKGEVTHVHTDYHVASGERRKTEFVLSPIRDKDGRVKYLLALGLDVTDRVKAQIELARLNRALRMLSSVNELLIRATNEEVLLNEICRLAVEVGGYKMAWVGYALNDEYKSIIPVAHYGDFAHLSNIDISWSESTQAGRGPAGITVRTGEPVIVEDFEKESSFQPWLESARRNGLKGVICLPLVDKGRVFGLFGMYNAEVRPFNNSEIKLLQELSDDLAFGILNLRSQEERHRLHAAVLKVAASVSASFDDAFFNQLTKNMAEASGADGGIIIKVEPAEIVNCSVLGSTESDASNNALRFEMPHSLYRSLTVIPTFSLFDEMGEWLGKIPSLKNFQIRACVGQSLLDASGTVAGLAILLFKRKVVESDFIQSTLRIFSTRANAELERLESEQHIRSQASMLDKAQDAIIVTDMDWKVNFWNKGAERLYGWAADEVLGKRVNQLLYLSETGFKDAVRTLNQAQEWTGEVEQVCKNGDKLIVESHWTLVPDSRGNPESILSINTDVTERKTAAAEIEYLAFYDPLTSLPNRILLMDRLKQALANCVREKSYCAILFIDLDNFKALNDTVGHDKGDLLLKHISERLGCCIRQKDTVARLGGDEFVVMLEDIGTCVSEAALNSRIVGEKILASLSTPYLLAGYHYQSSASIGITIFSGDIANVSEILKQADLAMYQAKSIGRNALRFYDPQMQTEITARVALETDLRQSLNKHQLLLHYQPQVNQVGEIVGAEALLRWQHPQRGMVSPAEFIPIAEESRMILPIGHWVMETACSMLVNWAMHPVMKHITVAVNVSPRQFRQVEFVDQVLGVLSHFGADPKKLKLEITESLFVDNVEDLIEKMNALRNVGISFSLDDFGTGYSSLSYLKRLPLDQLKIDQSFVRDIMDDPNDASIAQTIITLAQSLGIEVIAEGVETEAQKAFLLNHGCKLFQGYLFSRPVSESAFRELFSNNV